MKNNNNRIRIGKFVTIYARGKKQNYVADFWFEGKHCRLSLKTKNLRVARQQAVQLDSRLQQGLNPLAKATREKISIQEAADDFLEYLKTENRRPKTRAKYNGVFKKFIAFTATQDVNMLYDVDLRLVDRYRGARVAEVGKRSMHNEGVILKSFFAWCVERQLMTSNPLGSRKFHRPKYEPSGGPTLEQVNAILAIASPKLRPIIAVAAFTGRRSGEIEHLLNEDIDFDGNWVHIISRPGAETKSGNSGKVPIHPRLCEELRTVGKSNGKWFFTAPVSRQFPGGGHHLNMRDINEQFQELLKQLKIPAGKKNKGYVFHSLRSFFKTFCVNNGVPREVVDKWQDHAGDRRPSASDLYYKLSDEDSQKFMMKVPFGDGKPAADAGTN